MGRLVRAITADGFVQMSALDSRDIVQRAHEIHGTSSVVTAALGRTLTAASILGNALKGNGSSLTLKINGDGPVRFLLAVSDADGNVRGYAGNPQVSLPPRADGKLNVGAAVGQNGLITVIKDLNLREPYVGSARLVSGEIAEDVTAYLAESEQIPSACALGVLVSSASGEVLSAGGYVVQLLPGAPEDAVDALEENIRAAGPVTPMLEKGMTPEDIVRTVLEGLEPQILSGEEVEYRCTCSRRRAHDILLGLTREELEDMLREGRDIEMGCQFCDSQYVFTPAELSEILDEKNSRPNEEEKE